MNKAIILSTYHTNSLVKYVEDKDDLFSVKETWDFPRPMGIALSCDRKRLAIGLGDRIATFVRHNSYYISVGIHKTSDINIHEMAYTKDNTLVFNNTRYSCLSSLKPDCHFSVDWKPEWIQEAVPADKCHLNGLGLRDNEVGYVTSFNRGDTDHSWKGKSRLTDGVVIDTKTNKIVIGALGMPHSPRFYQGKVYVLESTTGYMHCVDLETQEKRVLCALPAFVRGLDFDGDFAYVGMSAPRQGLAWDELPVYQNNKKMISGFAKVNITTGEVVKITAIPKHNEIFDLKVIDDCDLIRMSHDLTAENIIIGA